MKWSSVIFSLSAVVLLSACLKTRAQLSGQNESAIVTQPQQQQGRFVSGTVNPQQRAQIDSRFYEIDRDFRQLYGKVESMENQLTQLNSNANSAPASSVDDTKVKELEKRIATLEEAVLALDKKVGAKKKNNKSSQVAQKPKGFFAIGKDLIAKKEYEKAILMFEKYRTKYPRGKKYASATFEIARCFEKLRLPRDAKAFYQEIIDRYPKTKMSARAKTNLKKIL